MLDSLEPWKFSLIEYSILEKANKKLVGNNLKKIRTELKLTQKQNLKRKISCLRNYIHLRIFRRTEYVIMMKI